MIAATLFSGIGAPETSMPDWDWRWCAEIEKFPSAVLKKRHPESVNLGDVNAEDFVARAAARGRPNVLVFGSPCQSFSIAGKRLGLDDARGNLALIALGIAQRLRPEWVVFENVPGIFSSYSGSDEAERALGDRIAADGWHDAGGFTECDEDSDFAALVSAFRECGYLGGYRIFDAQYSGVPQRRRRLFFVGYLGDWRPAAAVLLEPDSLRGDRPPSREARQGIATAIETSIERSRIGEGLVEAIPICESGKRASLKEAPKNGIGIGAPGDPSFTLGTDSRHAVVPPLNAGMGKRRGGGAVNDPMVVTGAVSAKWAKGTGGPAGDECYNLVACPDVADPIHTNEMRCTSHAGNNPRPRNLVVAFENRTRGDDGRGYEREPNFIEECSPTLNTVKQPVIAFDETQITHPENRSQPDDRSPQLAAGARPPTIAFSCKDYGNDVSTEVSPTLRAMHETDGNANAGGQVAVMIAAEVSGPLMSQGNDTGGHRFPGMSADSAADQLVTLFKPSHFTRGKDGAPSDLSPALSADADKDDQDPVLMQGAAVRRLTPRECERLQAFPDDYTLITFRGKPAADGPRYRALGNSMNVKDIGAILRRIDLFERTVRK